MYCENCGANIDESKDLPKFCPNCGAQIVKNADGTVNAVDKQKAVPVVITNVSEVKASTNGYAIIGLIMALIYPLALLGLIFGIVGLRNSKKINSGAGLSIAAITISSIWIFVIIMCFILMLAVRA